MFLLPGSRARSRITSLIERLASGNLLIGQPRGWPQAKAVSGDATLTAAGALTVGANVIGNSKLAQMPANTVKGNNTAGTANAADLTQTQLTAMINAFTSVLSGAASASGGGTTNFLRADNSWQTAVVSVTNGYGVTGGPITSSGSLAISLSTASNILGADVTLNNTGAFFDGPSMAQGTTGTWLAFGSVGFIDINGAANLNFKLWDGTTTITSAYARPPTANTVTQSIFLAGILASPAGNIRISVQDTTSANGKILFNQSTLSKDSYVFGVRIA